MSSGIAELGTGPRVVFVHGSVTNGDWLWSKQHVLAGSFTLVIPNRSGYPPHEPLDYIDFNDQADEIAELLDDGSHLVGFSYGGVVAMLAAERRLGGLASLTVIEPPALSLAPNADTEELAVALLRLYWSPDTDPREFLDRFMQLLGGKIRLPPVLPPDLEQGVRALMVERPPWDARFALDELARAPFPKLVVSGAHKPALEAVCDVLERRLGAERAIVETGSHNIPHAGDAFNEVLKSFLSRAEQAYRQRVRVEV